MNENDLQQHFRNYGRRASIAFVLIVLCVAIGFWIVTDKADKRTEKGTYGNCHRLNIVRGIDNENAYDAYTIFKSLIVLKERESKIVFTKEQQEDRKIFFTPIYNSVNNEKWIPLTNCKQAVDNPYHYIPPEPIKFSKEPPSYYAFHLGPDN